MDNVIPFPQKEDMLPVEEWTWSDFKAFWQDVAKSSNEDAAWKALYQIWQMRAGEQKISEGE